MAGDTMVYHDEGRSGGLFSICAPPAYESASIQPGKGRRSEWVTGSLPFERNMRRLWRGNRRTPFAWRRRKLHSSRVAPGRAQSRHDEIQEERPGTGLGADPGRSRRRGPVSEAAPVGIANAGPYIQLVPRQGKKNKGKDQLQAPMTSASPRSTWAWTIHDDIVRLSCRGEHYLARETQDNSSVRPTTEGKRG